MNDASQGLAFTAGAFAGTLLVAYLVSRRASSPAHQLELEQQLGGRVAAMIAAKAPAAARAPAPAL